MRQGVLLPPFARRLVRGFGHWLASSRARGYLPGPLKDPQHSPILTGELVVIVPIAFRLRHWFQPESFDFARCRQFGLEAFANDLFPRPHRSSRRFPITLTLRRWFKIRHFGCAQRCPLGLRVFGSHSTLGSCWFSGRPGVDRRQLSQLSLGC